jgi:hypothetical protein
MSFPSTRFLSRRESAQVCQLSFINPKHSTEWGSPHGQSQLTARKAHIYSSTELPRRLLPLLCNEYRGAVSQRRKRTGDISDHSPLSTSLVKTAWKYISIHTCIYVEYKLWSIVLRWPLYWHISIRKRNRPTYGPVTKFHNNVFICAIKDTAAYATYHFKFPFTHICYDYEHFDTYVHTHIQWNLRSWFFCNVTQHISVVTGVSGQTMGPIFKGQAVLDPLRWYWWIVPKRR